MRLKPGFTLVELLLSMTAGSVLMLLAMGVVHQAFSYSRISQQRADDDRRASRLLRQFREDVHAATTISQASADAIHLVTDSPAREIHYQIERSEIVRQQFAEGKLVQREVYALSEELKAMFEVLDDRKQARFSIFQQTALKDDLRREIRRVEAFVGRRHLYELAGGEAP